MATPTCRKAEVITAPPPEWLNKLAQQTFRECAQARQEIDRLDKKLGRATIKE